MARTKKAPALKAVNNSETVKDFTYSNPLYGGTRFNAACVLEYTVDMEQNTVLIRVTDEISGKVFTGSADQEAE